MTDSWDFDKSLTEDFPCKTQQINDESSEEDEEVKIEATLSQSIASNSDKEDHVCMSPSFFIQEDYVIMRKHHPLLCFIHNLY